MERVELFETIDIEPEYITQQGLTTYVLEDITINEEVIKQAMKEKPMKEIIFPRAPSPMYQQPIIT